MSKSTSSTTRTREAMGTSMNTITGTITRMAPRTVTARRESTRTMFEYDFMVNAFAASGIVAVLSGIVGYFLVMRGQTFAGHALSHVGFTGATGAVLLGVSPIWGMVGFTLAAGVGMG